MARQRLATGAAGVLLGLYGVLRLVTENSLRDLLFIAVWMVAAVAIHDGVLSPAVLVVGRLLRAVPARARRWVQLVLVVGALVTIVALPLLHKQGSQPESKALLVNDYSDRLTVLLVVLAVVGLAGYAVQAARSTRPGPDSAHSPDDSRQP
ncbi:MAG: hypothetical protein ABJA93_06765 [Sporichthyaceae bacterium]